LAIKNDYIIYYRGEKMNIRLRKILPVLCISFALMLCTSLSVFAIAAPSDGDQVHVIIENTNFTEADGAPWSGTLVDTWVPLSDTSTALSCIQAAAAPYAFQSSGTSDTFVYITSINNLTAGSAGGWDGWMVLKNDWLTNDSLAAYNPINGTLNPNDTLVANYSLNFGTDLGGTWSNTDKTLASMTPSIGTLSPTFSTDTKDYTLTTAGESSVILDFHATNKNYMVKAFVDDDMTTAYRNTDAIPIADGTVIQVICGDPEWPSMNNGTYGNGSETIPAETYTITIRDPIAVSAAQTEAIEAINAYKDSADYRDAEQTALATAQADGVAAIEAATTVAKVNQAQTDAQAIMNAIQTDAQLTALETTTTTTDTTASTTDTTASTTDTSETAASISPHTGIETRSVLPASLLLIAFACSGFVLLKRN